MKMLLIFLIKEALAHNVLSGFIHSEMGIGRTVRLFNLCTSHSFCFDVGDEIEQKLAEESVLFGKILNPQLILYRRIPIMKNWQTLNQVMKLHSDCAIMY